MENVTLFAPGYFVLQIILFSGKMSLKIRLRSLNRKVPQLEDIEGQRTTGFSNAAMYMRRYRGRIKADQECYVQYQAKETERVKEYRQTMSQEARISYMIHMQLPTSVNWPAHI